MRNRVELSLINIALYYLKYFLSIVDTIHSTNHDIDRMLEFLYTNTIQLTLYLQCVLTEHYKLYSARYSLIARMITIKCTSCITHLMIIIYMVSFEKSVSTQTYIVILRLISTVFYGLDSFLYNRCVPCF